MTPPRARNISDERALASTPNPLSQLLTVPPFARCRKEPLTVLRLCRSRTVQQTLGIRKLISVVDRDLEAPRALELRLRVRRSQMRVTDMQQAASS